MCYKLLDYIYESNETGVGLALRDNSGKYLFFIPGIKHKNLKNEIFYAGIGGHLENGEDFISCAKREVREELGANVEITSSEVTWHIHDNGDIREKEIEDFPKPLALYDMIHSKGTPKAGQLYKIVIYNAILSSPLENLQKYELGGVIALTKDQIVKSISRKPTLEELINEGASIVAGCEHLDFSKVNLYPIGTAKALGHILGL